MLRVNRHTRHMPVSVPIEFQPMPVPHRATGAACRPRFRRTDGIQPFVTQMSIILMQRAYSSLEVYRAGLIPVWGLG